MTILLRDPTERPKSTRVLRSAKGDQVEDNGDKIVAVKTDSGRTHLIRVVSAGVKKNLLAVSDLNKKGFEVVFSPVRGNFIMHCETGVKIDLTERNGVFEVTFDLLDFIEAQRLHPRVGHGPQ